MWIRHLACSRQAFDCFWNESGATDPIACCQLYTGEHSKDNSYCAMVLTQSIEKVESGLQYLSESKESPQSRSPNQELLPLTASVNSRDRLEIGGCEVTALVEHA